MVVICLILLVSALTINRRLVQVDDVTLQSAQRQETMSQEIKKDLLIVLWNIFTITDLPTSRTRGIWLVMRPPLQDHPVTVDSPLLLVRSTSAMLFLVNQKFS